MTTGRINQNATRSFFRRGETQQLRFAAAAAAAASIELDQRARPPADHPLSVALTRQIRSRGLCQRIGPPRLGPLAGSGPRRTAEPEKDKEDASFPFPASAQCHVLNATRSRRARPYRDQSSVTRWDVDGRNTRTPHAPTVAEGRELAPQPVFTERTVPSPDRGTPRPPPESAQPSVAARPGAVVPRFRSRTRKREAFEHLSKKPAQTSHAERSLDCHRRCTPATHAVRGRGRLCGGL